VTHVDAGGNPACFDDEDRDAGQQFIGLRIGSAAGAAAVMISM